MTRHAPVTPTITALTCNVTGRTRPNHALYAKNIHILKGIPIMALKSSYKATRGDARRLAKDVQPGDLLYIVHNVADRYVLGNGGIEDPKYYSVYVVTGERGGVHGYPMVCHGSSASGRGTQTVVNLLTQERQVLSEPPAGVRNIAAVQRSIVAAEKLADRVARLHAQEVAAERAKKAAKEPVGAGAGRKSSWF